PSCFPACQSSRLMLRAGLLENALLLDRLEGLARVGKDRRFACVGLPAPYRDVHIDGVDLERARLAAGAFSCDQDGAAAAKRVQHQTSPAGAILERVDHKHDRLDRRMHSELVEPPRTDAADARIDPDVGSMAPMLPKRKIVDVLGSPALPDENELMLRAI